MLKIELNNKIAFSVGDVIILMMVIIHPLLVAPGELAYFYGPRYIFMSIVSLFALINIYYSKANLKNNVYYYMFIFLLFASVSTILSEDPIFAWSGSPNRFTGLSTYLSCAILFITASKVKKPGMILRATVYCAVVVSLIAMLQHFGINLIPHELFRVGFHSSGTLGHWNFLGTYTILVIPASIMLYLHENQFRWIVTSVLIFSALIVSMTRGSWLAFLIIFMIIIIYVFGKTQFRHRLLKLAIIFAAIFILFSFTKGQVILNRAATVATEIESALVLEDTAGSNRMFIWKEAVKIIPQKWAFGVGPDRISIQMPQGYVEDKSFNHFLEIAVTMGLFALFAYLVFLSSCFIKRRKDWVGTTFTFMSLAYLIQGQFNLDVIMNLPLFWIALGLMQTKEDNDQNSASNNSKTQVNNYELEETLLNRKRITMIIATAVIIFTMILIVLLTFPRQGVVEISGEGIYTGQLRGSTFHGYGTWEAQSGVVYQGSFKHGLYDGYGTLTYVNGSKYIGDFKQGYFHGSGTLITADGKIIEGNWSKGELIK